MSSLLRRLGVAAIVALTAACWFAPSEESIRKEFDDYVEKANGCSVSEECTLASAGCPLGCVAAVRADRKDDVERKARALIREYESGGRSCDYDCVIVEAACVQNRCAAVPPAAAVDGGADAHAPAATAR